MNSWVAEIWLIEQRMYPMSSMYGISTFLHSKDQPNVGKCTMHGSYGYVTLEVKDTLDN